MELNRLFGEIDAESSENYLKITVDNTKTASSRNDNKIIPFEANQHK